MTMVSQLPALFFVCGLTLVTGSDMDRAPDFCRQAGEIICTSDKTRAICIGYPTFFQQIDIETCSAGYHCAYTNKECVPNSFTCHQIGVFPDPYDCHKYYTCAENSNNPNEYEATVGYCIRYYHFDLATGKCEQNSDLTVECEYEDQPVPPCRTFLQTGALKQNNSYYYLCAKGLSGEQLYPKLFKCGDDLYYNQTTRICIHKMKSFIL